MRVLVISNGNGEDAVAADLIAHMPPEMKAHAYPMIGAGAFFDAICPIVGPRAQVPSAGWRHTKGSMARDLKGGMLKSIPPAISFLRSCKGRYDKVIAIGDGVPPLLCGLAGLPVDIYIDVFKTGFAHRYARAERWVLKRACKAVYCRDDMLASELARHGLDAQSYGNIMLDSVPFGAYDTATRRKNPTAIALLPGSRSTAAKNLSIQLEAVARLAPARRPDIFVAVAPGLEPETFIGAKGAQYLSSAQYVPSKNQDTADLGALRGEWGTAFLARGAAGRAGVLGNLLSAADVVLSQAGTATQQALGLGKPVIAIRFDNDRPKRIADEQALMGEARVLAAPDAGALAAALGKLLDDETERARLGALGKKRLGGPGTRAAVIARLQQA